MSSFLVHVPDQKAEVQLPLCEGEKQAFERACRALGLDEAEYRMKTLGKNELKLIKTR